VFKRSLPVEYRSREATFAPWDALSYDREPVKRVLAILSAAFRWSVDDELRLRPEDEVWGYYYNYYPASSPSAPRWRRWIGSGPDELEMETLLRDLRRIVPAERTVDLHTSITVRELVDLLTV
jgi:hypothetical protein